VLNYESALVVAHESVEPLIISTLAKSTREHRVWVGFKGEAGERRRRFAESQDAPQSGPDVLVTITVDDTGVVHDGPEKCAEGTVSLLGPTSESIRTIQVVIRYWSIKQHLAIYKELGVSSAIETVGEMERCAL